MKRGKPIHKHEGNYSDPGFIRIACSMYLAPIDLPHSDDWDDVTCKHCRAKKPKERKLEVYE